MLSKLFKSVNSLVDRELRHNLRMNSEYRKYRWNVFERLLTWCSTYYGRAMFILWVGAIVCTCWSVSEDVPGSICQAVF